MSSIGLRMRVMTLPMELSIPGSDDCITSIIADAIALKMSTTDLAVEAILVNIFLRFALAFSERTIFLRNSEMLYVTFLICIAVVGGKNSVNASSAISFILLIVSATVSRAFIKSALPPDCFHVERISLRSSPPDANIS